jgi:hypothetical protein
MKTTLNVAKELADLKRLNVRALAEKYAELFGEETRTRNKAWLVKRIIWRLQAREEGDLSARVRARAAELADDADLRLSPPKLRKIETSRHHTVEVATTWDAKDRLPPPGTVIRRPYKGKTLEVRVLPTGFEYEGETYKSLSAAAKKITGSHCNGFQFFRLKNQDGAA